MSLPRLAAFGLMTLTGAVRPAPLAASLEVRRLPGATDCPDAESLRAAVSDILGAASGDSAAAERVQAEIVFEHSQGGYQAVMRLRGAREGTRTLTDSGPTCAALGRAAAIAVALLLDVNDEGGSTPSPSAARSPAARSPAAMSPATMSPSGTSPARTSVFLLLRGGPAWGYAGRLSVVGGFEGGLRLGGRASFLIGAEQVLSRSVPLGEGGVAVSLRAAHVAACEQVGVFASSSSSSWRFWPELAMGVCARAAAGLLHGEGRGFVASNAADLLWWSVGGEVRAEALVSERWILALAAAVEAPLHDYTFSVAQVGTVRGASSLIGQVLLGVGARLW